MKIPTLEDRLAVARHPQAAPVGRQRWTDLLFLHWHVDPAEVQSRLPPGLTVDTYEGRAWIGIVPFFMERIRPVYLPPLPWLSWFLELNVRTYVHDENGHPGVYFFSLDCDQPIAVRLARRFFHLPYFDANMRAEHLDSGVAYSSRRSGDDLAAEYRWRPVGAEREATPGSLEFFLVERYALFTQKPSGKLVTGRVHHAPYRIADAEVPQWSAHPAKLAGFQLEGPPLSALASGGVDVSVFAVKPVQ